MHSGGRYFVAFDLPAHARDELVRRQQRVCELLGEVARPVDPAQLHVTLAFLDERTADEVPAIIDHVEQCFVDERAFRLKTGPLCSVGGGSVLAVLLDGSDMARLRTAQEKLERRLVRDGLMPRERREWRPHVSVIRRRGRGRRLALPRDGRGIEEPITLELATVQLVRSQPAGNRHEHCSVHVVRLA